MSDSTSDLADVLSIAKPWKTIRGRVHNRFDEPLLDHGRALHHGEVGGKAPQPSISDSGSVGIEQEKAQFWATSSPFRLRAEGVDETPPNPSIRLTVVIDQKTWWAYDGESYLTNAADERYETGDFSLRTLLFPSGFGKGFSLESIGRREVEGRSVLELRGHPTEDLRWELPELVVLSSDDYRLEIDLNTGILVSWKALIDGRTARQGRLFDLEMDVEIEDELFLAPPGQRPLPPPEWPGGDPLAKP